MDSTEQTASGVPGVGAPTPDSPDREPDPNVNLKILLGGLPVAVFFVLTRFAPAWVAIGGGFLASVVVFRVVRNNGLIRLLTAFSLSILAVAGILGILWDSEKAYLAAGPLADFLFPVLHLGSLYVRRPLVGLISKEIVPGLVGPILVNDRVFVGLTLMWASLDIVRGTVLFWLLGELSVGEFIVYSRLFNWPINTALLVISITLISRRAQAVRVERDAADNALTA